MKFCVTLVFALLLLVRQAESAFFSLTVEQVANPPAVEFTDDTGLNSPPFSDQWVSYVIGITSPLEKISVVDVTLTGTFHQRWQLNSGSGEFDPTPSGTETTSGDSHLILPASPIVFVTPSENNNQSSPIPPLPDSASRDYGAGSMVKGAWGYTPAQASNHVNIAYLVIPRGEADIYLDVQVDAGDSFPEEERLQGDLCALAAIGCAAPVINERRHRKRDCRRSRQQSVAPYVFGVERPD